MATTAPTPPPRRVRKRVVIPAILTGGVLLLLLAAAVRGTWADATPRDPATSADGVLTQLYQAPDGSKQVRCAAVFDHPPEAVWAVVTAYDRFPEIFPTVASARATREPDGRYHLVGEVHTPVGDWPFASHITHEESADRFVARWDESDERLRRNRGSWVLTPAGPGRTLLVYTLEVEAAHYPTFLVRNVLLTRQRSIVEAVRDWLRRKPASP